MLSRDTGSSCSAATTSAGSTPRRRSTRPRLINGFIRELSLIEQLLWPWSQAVCPASEAAHAAAAALYCFRPHPSNAMTVQFVPPQQTSPGVGALVTKAAGERLVTQRIILLILCLFLARGGQSSHSKLSPGPATAPSQRPSSGHPPGAGDLLQASICLMWFCPGKQGEEAGKHCQGLWLVLHSPFHCLLSDLGKGKGSAAVAGSWAAPAAPAAQLAPRWR